ncbi:hypothetical protein JCM24511_09165 [Saitozyma sp. JCM 24511]|nr:hypothetical protein JCM24511_09165 [Saitozyma sp. JCM 24511]
MMYPEYGWGMMGTGSMMGVPGMMAGHPYAAMYGQMPGAATQPSADALKPFDASKMKASRLGHYGYLEGRELAGPPPGYLPAGMQPQQAGSNATGSVPIKSPAPVASTAYYPMSAPASQKSAWGDASSMPHARYDGAPHAKCVQADLDTPYPRLKSGSVANAWTRYDQTQEAMAIDGRLGVGHRRMKEGKV